MKINKTLKNLKKFKKCCWQKRNQINFQKHRVKLVLKKTLYMSRFNFNGSCMYFFISHIQYYVYLFDLKLQDH